MPPLRGVRLGGTRLEVADSATYGNCRRIKMKHKEKKEFLCALMGSFQENEYRNRQKRRTEKKKQLHNAQLEERILDSEQKQNDLEQKQKEQEQEINNVKKEVSLLKSVIERTDLTATKDYFTTVAKNQAEQTEQNKKTGFPVFLFLSPGLNCVKKGFPFIAMAVTIIRIIRIGDSTISAIKDRVKSITRLKNLII